MPAVLSLLFSKAGIVGVIALGLVLAFGAEDLGRRAALHGQKHAEADRDAALAALKTCSGRVVAQNAAVAAQAAQSGRAMSAAEKAQAAAAPRASHYADQAKALAAMKLSGATQCERWDDADRLFLERLK